MLFLALAMFYDVGMGMYILMLAIPLGFSQVLYSFADVLAYRKNSPFRPHLIVSMVTIVLIFITGYDGRLYPEEIRDSMAYVLALASILLAIYFWVLTFKPEWIVRNEHNVFEI